MLWVNHFLFLEPIALVCLTFLLSIVARPNPPDEPVYTVTFMTLVLKAKFTKTRCILRACGHIKSYDDLCTSECLYRQSLARLCSLGRKEELGQRKAGIWKASVSWSLPCPQILIHDGGGRGREWVKQSSFSIGSKHPTAPESSQPLSCFCRLHFDLD